jgi:hypothetical protein
MAYFQLTQATIVGFDYVNSDLWKMSLGKHIKKIRGL